MNVARDNIQKPLRELRENGYERSSSTARAAGDATIIFKIFSAAVVEYASFTASKRYR
jgi:hypothetical protein